MRSRLEKGGAESSLDGSRITGSTAVLCERPDHSEEKAPKGG